MIRRITIGLCCLVFVLSQSALSQPKQPARSVPALRFMDQIGKYKHDDSLTPPKQGTILFIGSSIFRLWENLKEDMAPLPVFNRAFGGSHTVEMLIHFHDLVLPYAPKLIVYYCGSNDVNANIPTAEIVGNFSAFADSVAQMLPGTRIVYVSVNRAPQKKDRWGAVDSINTSIRELCERSHSMTYIDVNPTLFDSAGVPRYELYNEDMLHFKRDAYIGFTKVIKPVLEHLWMEAAR